MYSIGLILSGFAVNTSMLLLTYGIIGGLGLGMAYGCTISTAVKYFPDKRGLIGGVTTAVYGLSSVIVSPIITIIVEKTNATVAFKGIGMVFLIVMVLCSLMVEACPADFVPEGYTKQGGSAERAGGSGQKLERNVTDTNFLCHDHFTDLRSFQWHDDHLTGSRACTGNGWND